jgi:acetyltransferase-like isoleucine patch superfamily enzyme
MRRSERIRTDRYVDVDYHQFTQPLWLPVLTRLLGVLSWPVVVPLALLSRLSDFIFVSCSQVLSLVPYVIGVIVRYEFYRMTLTRCGRNVTIGFGTVLLYRDISIGDHVLIGMYNTVHYCDFGSYVLVADGCRFLSGSKYHKFDRTDIPMALQGGSLHRVVLEDDCWIGANAVVMESVGAGSIVGAGSVVSRPVERNTIVAGVPAQKIGMRGVER